MPDTQSVQCGGNGCFIVQVQDDGNTVVSGIPHLALLKASAPLPPSDDLLALFDPWRACVPLAGRGDALTSLRSWLDREGKPISIRVLTGRGGTGKTRLALELCRELEGKNWQAGFVSTEEADRFFGQQNLGGWGWQRPVLAVFDYAMARTEQLGKWLKELCRNPGDAGRPLRILLLEREASLEQGWLSRLASEGDTRTRVQPLFDLPDPVQPLHPLHLEADRRAVLARGLELFGCAKTLPEPGVDPDFDGQLAGWQWAGDPLYLLLAACVAAEKGLRAALSLNREDAALYVAERELERIGKLAGDDQDARALLRHTAALATLRQGLERDGLRDVLKEEEQALDRKPRRSAARMAELLQEARPGPGGGVKAIEPDLIGEAVVLKGLGAGDADDARKAVVRAFGKALEAVVRSLVKLVQDFGETRGEPLEWLEAVSVKDALTVDELVQVVDAMPKSSVRLAAFAAEQTERLVERLRKESSDESSDDYALARLAATVGNLSIRLGNLGQHKDALAHALEAVDIYRKLTRRNPYAYRPDLANALNNLGIRFSSLGRHEDALALAQEAVDTYSAIATRHPGAYQHGLARSLNSLGVKLGYLGQYEEALNAARKAVDIFNTLAMRSPEAYRPELAQSLDNLGSTLGDLGRHEEALSPAGEATNIRRELATRNPDAYLPDLANSLNNLGVRFGMLGRHEEALDLDRQTVEILRTLVARNPKAYLHALAQTLNNLGGRLGELGRHEESFDVAREAVDIRRELAASNHDAHLSDLAQSLYNLSGSLGKLGQHKKAINPGQEAVDIYRELAACNPDAYLPDLAGSLNNLGVRHNALGRPEEALAFTQEAAGIYRVQAQRLPRVFKPLLAISLRNLARTLRALGREDEAQAALDEADRLTGENDGQASAQPE